VPGQFMSMLPITLIFVLSASLLAALIYLQVLGGVSGRMSRKLTNIADVLRRRLPWVLRAALVPISVYGMFLGIMQIINPKYLVGTGIAALIPGVALFLISAFCA
jgi:multidrug efflux pump